VANVRQITLPTFLSERAFRFWGSVPAAAMPKHLGLLDLKCGAETAIQRCGFALNGNVHFHTLMPDCG
jgi:hypothetical protein